MPISTVLVVSTRRSGFMTGLVALLAIAAVATPSSAQVIRQVTDVKTDGFGGWSIDDAGTLVVASLQSDPFGANPGHAKQVVAWELPAGTGLPVTIFSKSIGDPVSVSDDGQQVAFTSTADLVGLNPDRNAEVFLIQRDGSGLVQLTQTTERDIHELVQSGSGNRVLFHGAVDPLGTNPGAFDQLFVVDTSTAVVTQLTQHSEFGAYEGISISDIGDRIVFAFDGDLTGSNPDDSREVFQVNADGSNLDQVTSSIEDSFSPVISGNGNIIAFQSMLTISVITWSGVGLAALADGSSPSITDNGRTIYYSHLDGSGARQIFSIQRTVGVPVQLTNTALPVQNDHPIVSGDETRVVFRSWGGTYPGGNNPDGSYELVTIPAVGGAALQLTDEKVNTSAWQPRVTPDGQRVAFTNSSWVPISVTSIARIQTDGSDFVELVPDCPFCTQSSISSDGETVVFVGFFAGACASEVYKVQADGTNRVQLSMPAASCSAGDHAVMSSDGSTVVFQSLGQSGIPSDGGAELFRVPVAGGSPSQVVDDDDSIFKTPSISADGVWAAWQSHSNFDGMNPGGFSRVFRGRTDGSFFEIVGTVPLSAHRPDISGDGQRVVFLSSADPFGANFDGNDEVFLYDAVALTTQQMTVTTDGAVGANRNPRISADGHAIYFLSSFPFFGEEAGVLSLLYRIDVASTVVERAAGAAWVPSEGFRNNLPNFSIGADGSQVVFMSSFDINGNNADGNDELWLLDRNAPALIRPGTDAPTVVTWDVDPRAVRYDVIRGDVANLQAGAGGTVDLGPVVCLENDSEDLSTAGFEDPLQPSGGQVLFYVLRGSQGVLDGPGSYGQGSAGGERLPAAGDCAP